MKIAFGGGILGREALMDCKRCNIEITKTNPNLKYCKSCRKEVDKIHKNNEKKKSLYFSCLDCKELTKREGHFQLRCKECAYKKQRTTQKEYLKNNPQIPLKQGERHREKHREQLRIKVREYHRKNKEEINEKKRIYRNNNLIKFRAREIAREKNFRQPNCLLCILDNKTTKSDHFHHTDYECNMGFSVCSICHGKADKWVEA